MDDPEEKMGQIFYDENNKKVLIGFEHSAQKEIERLNDELTCGSEAFEAVSRELDQLKDRYRKLSEVSQILQDQIAATEERALEAEAAKVREVAHWFAKSCTSAADGYDSGVNDCIDKIEAMNEVNKMRVVAALRSLIEEPKP